MAVDHSTEQNSDVAAEVAARELRRACFHDAGHAVITHVLGGVGQPLVWKNNSGNIEEKAWRGTFRMFAAPGTIAPQCDLPWMVGLAGLVAEALAQGIRDPGAIWCELDSALTCEEVSETDIAHMGERWYDHFDEGVALLQEHWEELEREAQSLQWRALEDPEWQP